MAIQSAAITTYVPDVSTLTPVQLQAAQAEVRSWLGTLFPTLDNRPNSAVGDLIVAPVAALLALWQVSGTNFLSDLDMSNVSQGTVYNCAFVQAFLSTLGMSAARAQNSTGVVLLTYTVNQAYTINQGTSFQFNSVVYHPIIASNSPTITINPTSGGTGNYTLFSLGGGDYGVLIPVQGPAGTVVSSGAVASSDLTTTTLSSVTAVFDFDPGAPPTDLTQMAKQLPAVFPTSTPVTPNGAISWATTYFPSLSGVSPVVSGDREMTRDKNNILGLQRGCMDLHFRGSEMIQATTQVTLCSDPTGTIWTGALPLPYPPLLMDSLITAGGSTITSAYLVGNALTPARAPSPVCSYSSQEQLGIIANTTIPDTAKTFGSPTGVSNVTATSGSAQVILTGNYAGYWFNSVTQRNVLLTFSGATTLINGITYAIGNCYDNINGDMGTVYFTSNTAGTQAVLYSNEDAIRFFNGLTLVLTSSSSVFNPTAMAGVSFTLPFSATTALFNVACTYDPEWLAANTLIQTRAHRPPALDVLMRGFITVRVDSLKVYYRRTPGIEVSKSAAIGEIFTYINEALYPGVWEDSKIGEIMLYYGAAGMQRTQFNGVLFPSVAQQYRVNGQWIASPPMVMTSPDPGTVIPGVGLRNIGYIMLDASSIELIAIS